MEKNGESDHYLDILEILEILEIPVVIKTPFPMTPFSGPDFCLKPHSRDSFVWVSHSWRSKVKFCPIRLPIVPHDASSPTHTHHAERHSFVVSQILRHDNPKLDSKDDFNHVLFWGTFFRRNSSQAEFVWQSSTSVICLTKCAGEICQ